MTLVSSPEAYDLLHRGTLALADVEHNGIAIDLDYVVKTRKRLQQECKQQEEEMKKHEYWALWRRRYGVNSNIASSEQLATILFKDLKFEAHHYTAKGKASTDKTSLERIDDPFVRNYTLWAEKMKAERTFLTGIERETVNGRLHPIFSLHLVKTYRSSSEAPNFQNFPVRNKLISELVRSAFIPSPGCRLVEIDYSGIEVKVAACYHKDPTMLEYIHDPTKDMHRDMAAEIYMCDPSNVNKMLRYVAKNRYVFPEFYGSYYAKVAPDLWDAMGMFKLTIDKGEKQIPARKWLKKKGIEEFDDFVDHIQAIDEFFWNERFAVYNRWKKNWYSDYIRNGGYRTKTGFYIRGQFKRNDVINHPVQGSAFHCLLWSLAEINDELRRRKMKTKLVGQIHDSIVADVPANEYEEFLVLAKRIMTKTIRKHWKWIIVPLDIEAEACEVGENWFLKKTVSIA
jgi:DNA polymerase-1